APRCCSAIAASRTPLSTETSTPSASLRRLPISTPDHSGITTEVTTSPASFTIPGSDKPTARTFSLGIDAWVKQVRTSLTTAASFETPSGNPPTPAPMWSASTAPRVLAITTRILELPTSTPATTPCSALNSYERDGRPTPAPLARLRITVPVFVTVPSTFSIEVRDTWSVCARLFTVAGPWSRSRSVTRAAIERAGSFCMNYSLSTYYAQSTWNLHSTEGSF